MKKNRTAETFSEEYAQRNRIKAINECSWFCFVCGSIMASSAVYWVMCTVGVINIIYKTVAVIGFLLVAIGVISPLLIKKLTEIIKKAFSFAGDIILKVLLLPVYLILTAVNVFVGKKYSAEFGFINWEERNSAITAYSDFTTAEEGKYKHAVIGTVIKVLSFFINNRMLVLVPVVVLLLIIGVIMFFASSSVIFSFVYTLF